MKHVAVDACCLINLLAARAILPASPEAPGRREASQGKAESSLPGLTLHIPNIVSGESLYLLQPDDEDELRLVHSPINLTPYFVQGVFFECDIEGEAETDLFVHYATRLDDGEAACLAIAESRGWSLATDDRPATMLAAHAGVPVLMTAELVKHWARSTGANQQQVATALMNIQRFAKFIPRQNSPEAAWWFSHFPTE